MVCCWEIVRYKCQLQAAKRWETIKVCGTEEEAESWLRAEIKYGHYPCRVIKEEVMRIDEEN